MNASVARGIERCPYIQAVEQLDGEAAALRMACAVLKDVRGVPALDGATLEAFHSAHGTEGVWPIGTSPAASRCPFACLSSVLQRPAHAIESAASSARSILVQPAPQLASADGTAHPVVSVSSADFASISLAGFWVRVCSARSHYEGASLMRTPRSGLAPRMPLCMSHRLVLWRAASSAPHSCGRRRGQRRAQRAHSVSSAAEVQHP